MQINGQYTVGIANVNLCKPNTPPFCDYRFDSVLDGTNKEQWALPVSSFTLWLSGDDKSKIGRLGNNSKSTKLWRSWHPATHTIENNELLWSNVEWRHKGCWGRWHLSSYGFPCNKSVYTWASLWYWVHHSAFITALLYTWNRKEAHVLTNMQD